MQDLHLLDASWREGDETRNLHLVGTGRVDAEAAFDIICFLGSDNYVLDL